jgi:eukaryotic-like serine/threonine-protein kinase
LAPDINPVTIRDNLSHMTIGPGARLGPYEIQSAIGAGGMGEVYRARDTRLDRTVAVKVLPEHIASDPDFKQRFEREAKTLAALSHPHICPVFDVGSQNGTDFLVMEYLEGETLEQRLKKGALPLDQALQIGIQIADALAAAHRAGIIHRDLKPGNIILTKSGAKLLDFGLAKTAAPAVAGSLSMLPTRPPNLTAQGAILGTFQYMAPEQLEGQEADARTDIFAFGTVVYEVVTGKKAFEGKSQASLIAAILERDPPAMSSLEPMTPALLDHVVSQCLAKNPDERWQTAGDLMRELKWITQAGAQAGVPARDAVRPVRRERLAWVSALTLMTLIAAGMALWAFRPAPTASLPEMRVEITTPPTTDPVSLAISPDGQTIVFVATSEGRSRLWLRSLDSVSARPLAGTDNAYLPFWSPDSRSVGFFAVGQLKRIDIDGGSVQTLADAPVGRGGTWNREGTILFTPVPASPIFRIAATGGEPAAVTRLERPQQQDHYSPAFLPDGRHFLYYILGSPEARGVYVGQLDGSQPRRLLDADSPAVHASSGHLLFVRQGTLFAQQLDPVRLELTGNPVPVAEGIRVGLYELALAAVSVSAAGSLVYRSGSGGQSQLAWVDRSGKEMGKVGGPDSLGAWDASISPNDRRVALCRVVEGNTDVWLLDLGRSTVSRFTSDAGDDLAPLWSPDGTRIVFSSERTGALDLYQKPASGAGNEELLLATPQIEFATDWSLDGRFLLYSSAPGVPRFDIWALPMDGDRKPFPVVQTNFDERDGQFSPDGKWIAYVSNESGRFEIYVQPFPGSGAKSLISTTGGYQPRWRRDGKELFYIALDNRLMAVPIQFASNGQAVEAGAPVPLFGMRTSGPDDTPYMVASVGQRFLVNTVTEEAASPITLVLNWKATP